MASMLSSMRIICPNRISRRDWIIGVSLGCFVSLRTSSFHLPNLLVFLDEVTAGVDSGNCIDAIYLDFAIIAFDKVLHQ